MQDYFYVCPGHLKDRGFCTPVVDEAAVASQKKQEMATEVERVKREFEEKQQKKEKKKKEDDKVKSDDKSKDKDKDMDEDKKSDKNNSSAEEVSSEGRGCLSASLNDAFANTSRRRAQKMCRLPIAKSPGSFLFRSVLSMARLMYHL